MSETKEATYKSLLQRMVHMTEQRDFDEDLMKEVYGALLPPRKFEAANEKVARLTAERDDLSRKLAVAEGELTMVRQERDEQTFRVDQLEGQATRLIEVSASRIADLTRERDQTAELLETATKGAIDLAARIAELERQVAHEAEQRNLRHNAYVEATAKATQLCEAVNRACIGHDQPITHEQALDGIRELQRVYEQSWNQTDPAHAPAARYPEVVEFLDAVGDGPWSISTGICEGKAGYYVESVNIDKGKWFAGDTLAAACRAACRAALDSRKERSDG